MNTEEIRNLYKPEKIKLLLIGESPPNKGIFFYDSHNKCLMRTYTSRPFETMCSKQFAHAEEFLKHFKDKGCYLDDLSHKPVDHLDKKERREILISSIPALTSRLLGFKPDVICICLKSIDKYVRKAISESGIKAAIYTLPFAGNGHQNKYMSKLAEILEEHWI